MDNALPPGRCVVCRQAWDPCRKCKGAALRAKQDATHAANGTRRHWHSNWEDIVIGRASRHSTED